MVDKIWEAMLRWFEHVKRINVDKNQTTKRGNAEKEK